MSAGFTPGPWEVSEYPRLDHLAVFASDGSSALAAVWTDKGASVANLNARLIAAAPESYSANVTARAALVAAAETIYGDPSHDPELAAEIEAAIAALDAALAKARGK